MWKPNQGKRENVAHCEKFAMVFLAFSKGNISVRSDCKVHAFGGNHHYRWHLSHFWRRSNQIKKYLDFIFTLLTITITGCLQCNAIFIWVILWRSKRHILVVLKLNWKSLEIDNRWHQFLRTFWRHISLWSFIVMFQFCNISGGVALKSLLYNSEARIVRGGDCKIWGTPPHPLWQHLTQWWNFYNMTGLIVLKLHIYCYFVRDPS